jgi:hypothetical protein
MTHRNNMSTNEARASRGAVREIRTKTGERLTLRRYSPQTSDHQLTAGLIECYRTVFASPPWNEELKCANPRCDAHWGTKDRAALVQLKFMHCDSPVVDHWPRHEVYSDLLNEITSETLCTLAVRNADEVVGFCWGYPIEPEKLEKKLGIPVAASLRRTFGPLTHVGYQDEVGVIAEMRGERVGKALNTARIDDFVRRGLRVAVSRARRTPEPSVTFLWYTSKLGYRVIAEYPERDGRVILARDLKGLRQLL